MQCFMWGKKQQQQQQRYHACIKLIQVQQPLINFHHYLVPELFLFCFFLSMCRRLIHGLHCILFAIKFWCFDHRIDNKHILDSVSFFEIQIYLNALTVFE